MRRVRWTYDGPGCCCTSRPCRAATSGRRRSRSSTSSPTPASRCGRCCRWCPTHEEDRSPYNALSAMAGNPELISRARQVEEGLVDVAGLSDSQRAAYAEWCERAASVAGHLRRVHGAARPARPREVADVGARPARPRPAAGRRGAGAAPGALETLRFEQWVFAEQWRELKEYAASRGVLFFGDLPIFVSHDSADVWASRDLFQLDAEGQPITVTGVPPDYFAADGQRWNNPHYDWDRMAERRVRVVAAADRAPAGAVRPGADRPLPRVRGGLARAGGGGDREGRVLGEEPGSRGRSPLSSRPPGPGRSWPRTSG